MKKPNELTISEAVAGLKSGELSSAELTAACLDQIEARDGEIRAFLTVTREKALEQTRVADQEIADKGAAAFEEKPLLGMPYACKDNYNTKGIETTASSNVLKGYTPPYEATVTKKLADAGAVLLGKTNMDAFAHGSSTETSDFGPTKNPHDLTRSPGGSSGGSGAAVAADMCTFAIGSETAGSIRGPASWCGVTGLKPTYGRVSRYGLIAMASSTDSPGPLTKTAEDAATILQVIAGKDPLDATTSPTETEKYAQEMKNVSLKGLKVGKPKSYFEIELEKGVKDCVEAAIQKLSDFGAEIVELDLFDPKYAIALYTILQRSEVSSNLARFDGIRFGQDRDSFGFEAKKRMMLGAYTLSAGYYDEYYTKAQKVRTLVVEDFARAFEKVDVIAGPAMPCIATKLEEGEKSALYGEMMDILNEPGAIAGLPAVCIPCGESAGMPVGLQFMGPMFSESLLLGTADTYTKSSDSNAS